ncbi:hypothetical protein SKAU_G00204550 [Synaphobranchus kaupii]|uniref:Uncharacterized protein n=1 Tax=Synaphobranchus kaupii TaxID=118154 RepID=A0A9Q1FG37_SYNKA|nr:hypothetical protein SKAU_G00204550 [Synaphobranchus kaupii]
MPPAIAANDWLKRRLHAAPGRRERNQLSPSSSSQEERRQRGGGVQQPCPEVDLKQCSALNVNTVGQSNALSSGTQLLV